MNVVGVGLICFLYLLSIVSNGFSVLFQSLHQFPSDGLLLIISFFLREPLNSHFHLRLSLSKSTMASSQVEIASSSPFGCVLRDHNRRDRCSNTRTTFQKNLKDLVRDHLHTCISNSAPPDENSQNISGFKREELLSPNSPRNARVLERWAKAREVVTSIDRQSLEERENTPAPSNSSVEIPNLGGVSSLVQRWRDFTEAASGNNPNSSSSPVCSTGKSYSGVSIPDEIENASFVDLPLAPRSETCDSIDERFDTPTPSMMTEDSFMDWESDLTALSGPPSVQGRDSDVAESEKLRVADVIRKLTSENQMQGSLMSWKNDHDREAPPFGNESLPRLRTVLDHQAEQRGFLPVTSSPRIRGRQAFNDLLMQLERDRHMELDGLVKRRAVSRFSHRGRIQSMLRLRFLRREAAVGSDQLHSKAMPVGARQHSHSRVVGAQQQSHSEPAVGPQHHSSHEGIFRNQQSSCHGVQQHSVRKAAIRPQHHSHSTIPGLQQHSNSTEAGIVAQQDSYSKAVGVQQNSQSEAALRVGQHSHSTPSESSTPRQGSAVVLPREKFDARVEHDAVCLKPLRGVVINNIPDVRNSCSSNQLRKEISTATHLSTFSAQNLVSHATEDVQGEASPSSDVIRQGTSYEVCNLDSQESTESLTSNSWEENVNAEQQMANNRELTATNEGRINDVSHQGGDWEEQEGSNQHLVGTDEDWISEVSRPWSEWDEQEANNQQIIGTNQDWVSDIARPRSDWEGLRQARYQELLDPYLDNGEIRQLLERRSVSTFLSSNLRDTMDQLMISRAERRPHSMGNEQEDVQDLHNRLEQLMLSQIQRQTQTTNGQQEDGEQEKVEDENEDQVEDEQDEEDDEEEENEEEEQEQEERPIRRQYSETGDYVDQVVAGVRSWSHESDHEVSDDFDQVASPSSQPPQSSQASYPDTQLFSSFANRSSIEMECIYDLRGHMEQLHHEMAEIRKSLQSCMNMQAKLQRSIKHEVADAVSRSVRRMGKESLNGGPRKRSCCICYEMQVDSLLYRCGHMCTCFNCAHELQWSSGKCPICRAPIVDVVRAYANDS
ncbi:Protein neuralized like [Actinidia chinensis var. chinensis]|uniref:Protein neuralized like n=1 Tax=Actinidia chinensis var. chinensis TaxID=1590841 RepID=A0A2R6QMB2_ACTCC|nr:Protein neuralized like [Actinidia chinensis var. chinensis]